jgi:ribose transport system substrate-binding protein
MQVQERELTLVSNLSASRGGVSMVTAGSRPSRPADRREADATANAASGRLVGEGSSDGSIVRGAELHRLVASTLMAVPVGARLPTIRDLAARFGASRSSVHLAIAQLEEEGAVAIEQRGRLGAWLAGRSLTALWRNASSGPFVAALPLPSTTRIQGLATGIKTMLRDAGVDSFLIYVRDPQERLQALEDERCHLAVMSALDADETCTRGGAVVEVLSPGTFAEEHRVFMTSTPRWNGSARSSSDVHLPGGEDLAIVGPHGESATPYTAVRLDLDEVEAVRDRHLRAALVWAYPNPFFEALTAGIAGECERLGIEIVSCSDYGSRPSRMKAVVAAAMSRRPDILLTISIDPDAGADACRQAVSAGVRIVFLSSLPRGFVAGRDCVGTVTGDQHALSRGAIDMLADALGGRGSIGLIYWDTHVQVENQRVKIAKTVLARDYPSISIVAERGAANPRAAERAARGMIAAHPEIGGMYVTTQDAAEGVVAALRAAGRPDVKVTTIDLGPNTLLDMIRGGNIQGLAVEFTTEMGATMLREAALAVLGKDVPPFTVVNALSITRVAVDRDSATARRLAKREFPDRLVQVLAVTYPQLVRLFQDGGAEVAIWDVGEEHDLLPSGTVSRPLSDPVQAEVGDRATRAAFVTRPDADFVRALVHECIEGPGLLSIQQDVIAGTRLPDY